MSEFVFSTLCVIAFLIASILIYNKMNMLKIYRFRSKYGFNIAVAHGIIRPNDSAVLKKLSRACPDIIILFDDENSYGKEQMLANFLTQKPDTDVFIIRKNVSDCDKTENTIENGYKIYSRYSILGYNGENPDIDVLTKFEKLDNLKIIAVCGIESEINAPGADVIISLKRKSRLISLPLLGKMIVSRDGMHFCIKNNNVTIPASSKKTEISIIKI